MRLLFFAWRNIWRNRRRTALTLTAMMVGVCALVCVRGLVDGLQRAMVENVTQTRLGGVQVHRRGGIDNLRDVSAQAMPQALVEKLRHVSFVTAATGRILFMGRLCAGDKSLFTGVVAVDPTDELRVCPERAQQAGTTGHFIGPEDTNQVLVSQPLARSLALGTTTAALVVEDHEGAWVGENVGTMGLWEPQLSSEKRMVTAHIALAQRLLSMQGQVTEIALRVEPVERSDDVAAEVRGVLGPGYEVQTWADLAQVVCQSIQRENFQAAVIALCFLTMMLCGVANSMLLSMQERVREIGTMMALGFSKRTILGLLLAEAGMLGAMGAGAGVLLGVTLVQVMHWHGVPIVTQTARQAFVVRPFVHQGYLLSIAVTASAGSALATLVVALRALRRSCTQALAGM